MSYIGVHDLVISSDSDIDLEIKSYQIGLTLEVVRSIQEHYRKLVLRYDLWLGQAKSVILSLTFSGGGSCP